MGWLFPCLQYLLGERDEEVGDGVHLSFGQGLTLGQPVHGVQGGIQQGRSMVSVTEEMAVVCQERQHVAPDVTIHSQGHVILRGIHLL